MATGRTRMLLTVQPDEHADPDLLPCDRPLFMLELTAASLRVSVPDGQGGRRLIAEEWSPELVAFAREIRAAMTWVNEEDDDDEPDGGRRRQS